MRKKECPSCAMMVDESCTVCPICTYEFAGKRSGVKWIAIALAVFILLYSLGSLIF